MFCVLCFHFFFYYTVTIKYVLFEFLSLRLFVACKSSKSEKRNWRKNKVRILRRKKKISKRIRPTHIGDGSGTGGREEGGRTLHKSVTIDFNYMIIIIKLKKKIKKIRTSKIKCKIRSLFSTLSIITMTTISE